MTDRLPDFDLSAFLPYRMAVLADHLSAGMAKRYRDDYGISVAEWRVLVHVADSGAVSVRDIERRVHLEKSKASRAATRLQTDGYLTKDVNEADRRLVVLKLTPKGEALMAELLSIAIAFQSRLDEILAESAPALDAAYHRLMEQDL